MVSKVIFPFKRGDDFSIDMTVTDKNNTTAVAAAEAVVVDQAAYDAALAVDPQVAQDVTDTLAALTASQSAYATAIIVDITGWSIFSQIRWCSQLVDTLVVTMLDEPNGIYNISIGNAFTSLWTPRVCECDIQFTIPSSGVTSSKTFIVDVQKDISYV